MRMYVKVMAAVIACILLSGEALSAFATTPATENLSWFKKKKKKRPANKNNGENNGNGNGANTNTYTYYLNHIIYNLTDSL